jgi:hypothetical protein
MHLYTAAAAALIYSQSIGHLHLISFIKCFDFLAYTHSAAAAAVDGDFFSLLAVVVVALTVKRVKGVLLEKDYGQRGEREKEIYIMKQLV